MLRNNAITERINNLPAHMPNKSPGHFPTYTRGWPNIIMCFSVVSTRFFTFSCMVRYESMHFTRKLAENGLLVLISSGRDGIW